MQVEIRRAGVSDVRPIAGLIRNYAGILLERATVALFESVQEFWVAETGGAVIGCGAVHVLWDDLAEVRSVAVEPEFRGCGVGHRLLTALIAQARRLGVARVFVLTFETGFFGAHGFTPIEGAPVSPEVYAELLRSYDEGVAEFLDLEWVKPNTLGNTRMLCRLDLAQ